MAAHEGEPLKLGEAAQVHLGKVPERHRGRDVVIAEHVHTDTVHADILFGARWQILKGESGSTSSHVAFDFPELVSEYQEPVVAEEALGLLGCHMYENFLYLACGVVHHLFVRKDDIFETLAASQSERWRGLVHGAHKYREEMATSVGIAVEAAVVAFRAIVVDRVVGIGELLIVGLVGSRLTRNFLFRKVLFDTSVIFEEARIQYKLIVV